MRTREATLRMIPVLLGALVGGTGWSTCGDPPRSDRGEERRRAGSVTFALDVAPILHQSCASCHRPEGSAPFSLLTHEDAAPIAAAIAEAAARGRMPPWLPARRGPRFTGERRLTPEQVGVLGQWAREGAPLGDSTAIPPPPHWPAGWQLGEPDLVLSLAEPYPVAAGAPEEFRNFVLENPLPERRYVHTVEFRFSDRRVVHHAMLMVDSTRRSRLRDAGDPAPGHEGMVGSAAVPQGFFVGWTPGRVPKPRDDGLAWRLDPGSDLVLQVHLRPGAEPARLTARIGLYFAERPPARTPTMLRLGSEVIDIRPGDGDYTIEDAYRLPVDVDVLGVYPHLHYLGKSVEAWAVTPGGDTTWLIDIPAWSFDWQDAYYYAEAVSLSRGSTIQMRYTYDNTAANPRNPSTPPVRVGYGSLSTDEMGDLWLSVMLRDDAALAALHADYGRNRIATHLARLEHQARANPRDENAHNALGTYLLRLGRVDEAIARFEDQLAVAPGHANAHFNLAIAMQRAERLDEAIAHYGAALRLAPTHADAATNLGNTLLATGRQADAIRAYERALRVAPAHADAHYNLGQVLLLERRTDDGIRHLRAAMRARPEWAAPATALAWALATHPSAGASRAGEAVEVATRAVELTNGEDPSALKALAAAHAAGGRADLAVVAAEQALAVAVVTGDAEVAAEIRGLLRDYRERSARERLVTPAQ